MGPRAAGSAEVRLSLPYRPPLDAAGLLEYLGRRAVPGVEEVQDGAYRRSLRLPGGAGVLELRPAENSVQARYWLEDDGDLAAAVERSRALLDLDCDPDAVTGALGSDPLIGPLVRAAPGRRVAGHVDGAELAARAVLGQQVSVAGAVTHTARLVSAYGEPLSEPVAGVTHLFPASEALAGADPEAMAMPRSRARALIGLARALANGELVLDAGADREQVLCRLLALPGIGPWTASYVAMRALRDPDAFLPSDLGVRRALERLGEDGRPASAARLAERWRPYRAYGLQYLWASLATAPPPGAALSSAAILRPPARRVAGTLAGGRRAIRRSRD